MALDYTDKRALPLPLAMRQLVRLLIQKRQQYSHSRGPYQYLWAPLEKGLESVSLSANWMWPCNNAGEDARLYIEP